MLARSYLYVPGHRPALAAKAARSDADVIVVDLEDGVPPSERTAARQSLAEFVAAAARAPGRRPSVAVRVNPLDSAEVSAELAAAVDAGIRLIRIPKVASISDVQDATVLLATLERRAGVSQGMVRLQLGIESALGVLRAADLAACDRVVALALGATDLAADLGLAVGDDGAGLLTVRSLLVLASAGAGIAPPIDSVQRELDDLDRLRASSERSRAIGFHGRSAIHPAQIPVLNEVFTPSAQEVAWARNIVELQIPGAQIGEYGPGGREMVDAAVVRRARRILLLAGLTDEDDRASPDA